MAQPPLPLALTQGEPRRVRQARIVAADHSTALGLADSGRADPSSLLAAIDEAHQLAAARRSGA